MYTVKIEKKERKKENARTVGCKNAKRHRRRDFFFANVFIFISRTFMLSGRPRDFFFFLFFSFPSFYPLYLVLSCPPQCVYRFVIHRVIPHAFLSLKVFPLCQAMLYTALLRKKCFHPLIYLIHRDSTYPSFLQIRVYTALQTRTFYNVEKSPCR